MSNIAARFERVTAEGAGAEDNEKYLRADREYSPAHEFGESGLKENDRSAVLDDGVRSSIEGDNQRFAVSGTADSINQGKGTVNRDEEYLREIASQDKRLAALERVCKNAIRERELAMLLSGRTLVPGAAAQLIKLWSDQFDVYEDNGVYKVASREGRSAEQVVNDWLASAEYSHFCLPASRGGTGARDASKPTRMATSETVPRNLGEMIVMKWREESAAQPESLLKPIGLRRNR